MSQFSPPSLPASGVPPFPQAVVTLRSDGTVAAWNAGATALYGLTEEEALGQPMGGLLPTTWPEDETEVAAAVTDAGGWVGVVVRRNRDGDALLLLAIRSAAPGGGVIETTLRLPDEVAAVALAPEEVERTDRLFVFEPVVDEAGEIVDMTIVYANLEAAVSLGRMPEDLVGRRGSEVMPGTRRRRCSRRTAGWR